MATNNNKANYERALDKIAELEADRDALRRELEGVREDSELLDAAQENLATAHAMTNDTGSTAWWSLDWITEHDVIGVDSRDIEEQADLRAVLRYALDAARTASEKEERDDHDAN